MKRRDFTRSFGREYDGPRMRNPFFAAHTPHKAVKYLLLAAGVVVIVGIPALLIYAPFMRYDNVQVNGLTTLTNDEVLTRTNEVLDHRRAFIFPGRNIFFTNTDGVLKKLDENFHFATLTLHREGRTLVIDAHERITEVAWTTATATYFIDLNGIAARDATPEAIAMIAARRALAIEIPAAPGVQPTMPILDVQEAREVTLGSNVIDATRLENILTLDAELRNRGLVPSVYALETHDTPWIKVSLINDPSLLVDITTDPHNTLTMYDTFARDRNGDLSALSYIDLRFGNHIYSKNK